MWNQKTNCRKWNLEQWRNMPSVNFSYSRQNQWVTAFLLLSPWNCEDASDSEYDCSEILSATFQFTVKLRIEAPGFYQYKWVRPPACMRGPASIRGPACIITCQVCVILFQKNRQLSYLPGTSILFIFTLKHRILRSAKAYKVYYIS